MDSDDDVFCMSENVAPVKAKAPKKAPAKAKKPAAKKASAPARKALKDVSKSRANALSDDDEEDEEDEDKKDEDVDMEEEPDNRAVEQIYQKKTQLEHILLRPDTYVGSIEPVTQNMWVFDDATKKMELRKITFVPGLYKIFDEIIVNACDNKQRDKSMDTLKVTIDEERGEISVMNTGKGIPVVLHKEHNVYVPELIFGHLLTGSNFDDKKKKTTGGRNGYGAKLANIFSKEFIVETADSSVKKRYKQVFSDNMSKKGTPEISSWSKKDFTCITFRPDLERFKMTRLDEDIVSLFKKRVYDVAGVSDKSLKVYLNEEKISIKSFPEYVELYQSAPAVKSDDEENETAKKPASDVIFDKPDSRWHVGVGLSEDGFQQVSFVNGICTTKGGQHVNYITEQIVTKLIAAAKKRNKGEAVKPNYVKNHMTVYVTALIDNPAFDSQTKETLTTRPASFGSTYTLSDKFLKQIEKSGIVDRIVSFAEFKQTAELRRKAGGGGGRNSKITGIPKLDDANFAGTAKSKDCTLIITEGDSAKSLTISGISVVGRDYYGVFPLRGKLLNVREASHSQILKNEEIKSLVKILGLKYGQKYDSTKGLRYGHLMIMTDQDYDGSHIKGLVINFLHHFWPSLLQVDGFLQEFITPIVKCTKGRSVKVFYTIPEYEKWRLENNNGRGWNCKYYKGLGTSLAEDMKRYFSDLGTHQIGFSYEGEQDGDIIDMAFSKKRVDDRKEWLRGYAPGTHVDFGVDQMSYTEFVNKELILFSRADNVRSIPSVVDGFKPSQRKVLYACFKRNLKNEIKVAQLGGYVAEHSAYHHGEGSLYSTIINMAQDFVGSNNINLLSPNGQFGSRLQGGKDASSPRYIFTNLEKITRSVFDANDHDILTYLDDDGQPIEPEWYVPIIPMILVNGGEGIGTGWSCSIPNYNPQDIIRALRQKINGEEASELIPWYRGFAGTIVPKAGARGADCSSFIVQGLYEIPDEDTLVITELPVKTWTIQYKQFLEGLLETEYISDFKENHTDTKVHFTITMPRETLRTLVNTSNGIIKKFKLESTVSTSNMHLFDAEGRIKKYETPFEILEEFYGIRHHFYEKRKASMLQKLQDQITLLSNKTRFVLSVVNGELIVSNRKKSELLRELEREGYDTILSKPKANSNENSDDENDEVDENDLAKGYDYLLSMKIWSLTKERVEKLRAELQLREQEYIDLEATSIEQLWLTDLDKLEAIYVENEEMRAKKQSDAPKAVKPGKPRAKKTKKAKFSSDDEDDSDFEGEKPKAKPRAKASKPAEKPMKTEKPTKTETTKTKTATTKVKPAPKPKQAAKTTAAKSPKIEPKEESDDDIEVLSLAERLARRVEATPKKERKAAMKQEQSTHPMDVADSEDEFEPSGDESDASDDDVFAMKFRKKAAPKAEAAPAAKKAAPVKKEAVSSTTTAAKPRAPKRPKEKTPKKAPRKPATSALETPTRASPAPKKQKRGPAVSLIEVDDDEDEVGTTTKDFTPIAARRGTRVRSRITYDEISDSDDDDVEFVGTTKHGDDEDESEFSGDEGDSDDE